MTSEQASPVPPHVEEHENETKDSPGRWPEADTGSVNVSSQEEIKNDDASSVHSRTRRRIRTKRARLSSDNDSSFTASSTDSESDIDVASRLSNVGLFEAYVRKLEGGRKLEGPKPRGPPMPTGQAPKVIQVQKIERRPKPARRAREMKGPRLVESFIDYVHGLESRIDSLEAKLKGEDKNASEKEEKKEEDDDDDDDEGDNGTPQFKIKFFHINDEVNPTGRFKAERDAMLDTYHSILGPEHFIRVVYRWRNEAFIDTSPNTVDEETLRPEDIEVVGFRITSIAISSYFGDVLKLGVHDFRTIELFKPYRCIIRALPDIRKHLDTLEAKWGSSDMSKDSDHAQASKTEDQEHTENGGKPPPDTSAIHDQPNKPLDAGEPPPVKLLPVYERPEALTHFRELLKFVDKYLKPQIMLYEKVREGLATKIAFENLWMLFSFNETIYCPIKRGRQEVDVFDGPGQAPMKKYILRTRLTPQAYRVVYTDGGIALYNNQTRDDDSMITSTSARKTKSQNQEDITVGTKEKFCPLTVYCFSVGSDAERYAPVEDFFVFKPFEGEVDITSLEAYPLRFHRQQARISEMLLERGRKFIDMTSISHMTYEGLTVGNEKEEVVSSVIVDIKLFNQENQSKRLYNGPLLPLSVVRKQPQVPEMRAPVGKSRYANWYTEFPHVHKINPFLRRRLCEYEPPEQDRKLDTDAIKKHMEDNDFIRLLPGEVPGFVLRSRKWVQLDINLLQRAAVGDRDDKPLGDTAGWRDLVLPPGHKDIVLAMVKSHTANTKILKDGIPQVSEVDLVKGKGKGCIILIHGAPGVGKTSTAECVAAYTRRPLFPITCGNIGYQPDEVEKNLDRLFNLAHRWGCVLLLDEADVFLAKRNKEDIKRNGLVSIFLRTLEYYSGILFLTTNRVGAIDDAFRSRLHLTLYYPQLDRRQSRKIWKVNLRRLKEINEDREKLGHPKIRLEKEKILKYADLNFEELHWNGRQIRNAFQSALALADFAAQDTGKPPTLSFEQFDTIARASLEFDHYLHNTHGLDEEKMAARDRVRGAYKRTEVKLKSLPLSEESDSSSDSDAAEAASQDSSQSAPESESSSQHKKGKKSRKVDQKKRKKNKKARKDNAKGEKKKTRGKEKEKDADESDGSSDSDE
ncbi:hypothetical protein F5Y05DRAFT_129218 [Hypoxylon sp. FL0543]|nr:hypothetical protein F5Y05DRAFT_129218 [Hypoxylon sp. FL0543]